MGTRSTIKFKDNGTTLLSIYQQYDGYLEGKGEELAKWLAEFTIVNGYSSDTPKRSANGIGCLAAQYIAEHKEGIGNIYCTTKGDLQEYNYIVAYQNGEIQIVCDEFSEFNHLIEYNGEKWLTPQQMIAFINQLD